MAHNGQGSGAATPERCHRGYRSGLAWSQEKICTHSPVIGIIVGASKAMHPFSSLLLALQGFESCCWIGSIPLFRMLSRRTLYGGKNAKSDSW